MSLLFSRVNEIKYENQPTFELSSAVYNPMLGDHNMPTSTSGGLPVVVEVPLGIIAALLNGAGAINLEEVKAGKLTEEDLAFWKVEPGEETVALAIGELQENARMLKLLLSDYRIAVIKGWGGILYHV